MTVCDVGTEQIAGVAKFVPSTILQVNTQYTVRRHAGYDGVIILS